MRHIHPATLVSIVVALSAMACSGRGKSNGSAGSAPPLALPAPSSSAAPVAASASATASPSATSTHATAPIQPSPPKRRALRAPKDMASLEAELGKKCPVAESDEAVQEKLAAARANECRRKRLLADLDALLVPMKASDPRRFKALMKEQAEWNRAMKKACDLEEERAWVDFDTGDRSIGSYASLTRLECQNQAITERILYVRTLAAGKPGALAKRIGEVQANGVRMKQIAADILQRSMTFATTPPSSPTAWTDWSEVVASTGHFIGATKSLAKSTCQAWPELEKALGGKEKCLSKTEAYYYVQGNAPGPSGLSI